MGKLRLKECLQLSQDLKPSNGKAKMKDEIRLPYSSSLHQEILPPNPQMLDLANSSLNVTSPKSS